MKHELLNQFLSVRQLTKKTGATIIVLTLTFLLLQGQPQAQTLVNYPPQKMTGAARDIDAKNGHVWIIGTAAVGDNYQILKLTGSSWIKVDGEARRIAVEKSGNPWVVNSAGRIYRRVNNVWQLMPGPKTMTPVDIAISNSDEVWITEKSGQVLRWTGSEWITLVSLNAKHVIFTPNPDQFFVVDQGGKRFFRESPTSWLLAKDTTGLADKYSEYAVELNGTKWGIDSSLNIWKLAADTVIEKPGMTSSPAVPKPQENTGAARPPRQNQFPDRYSPERLPEGPSAPRLATRPRASYDSNPYTFDNTITNNNKWRWTGGSPFTRIIYNPLDGGVLLKYTQTGQGNSDGCSAPSNPHYNNFFQQACFAHDTNYDAPFGLAGFPAYADGDSTGKDLSDYLFLKDMQTITKQGSSGAGLKNLDASSVDIYYRGVVDFGKYRGGSNGRTILEKGGVVAVKNKGAYTVGLRVKWTTDGVTRTEEIKKIAGPRAAIIPLSSSARNIEIECWAVGGKQIFKRSFSTAGMLAVTVGGTTLFPSLVDGLK